MPQAARSKAHQRCRRPWQPSPASTTRLPHSPTQRPRLPHLHQLRRNLSAQSDQPHSYISVSHGVHHHARRLLRQRYAQSALTFIATVKGANPTGTVTFLTGTTPLGTATITNGTATLSTSFTAINTYSVVANYAGDGANLPSTSSPVSITISIPDFTLTSQFISATIPAGQTITTRLIVTPLGGYSGMVKFSCSALPFGTTCSFSSPTVTVANGLNETTTLTISTTAPFTATASVPPRKLPGSAPAIAWASLFLCLASLPQRMHRLNRQATRSVLLMLLLITGFLSVSGCSSSPAKSSPTSPISTPGTPSGPQSVTVTAADTAGGPSHSTNIQLTIQ
jgi:hypothetical protein